MKLDQKVGRVVDVNPRKEIHGDSQNVLAVDAERNTEYGAAPESGGVDVRPIQSTIAACEQSAIGAQQQHRWRGRTYIDGERAGNQSALVRLKPGRAKIAAPEQAAPRSWVVRVRMCRDDRHEGGGEGQEHASHVHASTARL